jgi:hypothetical protein
MNSFEKFKTFLKYFYVCFMYFLFIIGVLLITYEAYLQLQNKNNSTTKNNFELKSFEIIDKLIITESKLRSDYFNLLNQIKLSKKIILFTDNKIEKINSRDSLVLNKTYVFIPFLFENKSINNSLEFTSIVNINKLNNSLELNITNKSNNSLKLDLLSEVTTMINQLTNSLELNKSIELIPAVFLNESNNSLELKTVTPTLNVSFWNDDILIINNTEIKEIYVSVKNSNKFRKINITLNQLVNRNNKGFDCSSLNKFGKCKLLL